MRLDILSRQSRKQQDDLRDIDDEKVNLQERMETLAEKYEDAKDRQELILRRFVNCYVVFKNMTLEVWSCEFLTKAVR